MNLAPETDEELEQLIKQANDEGGVVQKQLATQQNGQKDTRENPDEMRYRTDMQASNRITPDKKAKMN